MFYVDSTSGVWEETGNARGIKRALRHSSLGEGSQLSASPERLSSQEIDATPQVILSLSGDSPSPKDQSVEEAEFKGPAPVPQGKITLQGIPAPQFPVVTAGQFNSLLYSILLPSLPS